MKGLSVILIVFGFSIFSSFSQSVNSISLIYSKPLVYKTKNSLSDNFYSGENGNIRLLNLNGIGLQYNRLVLSEKGVYLRSGLELIRHSYSMPYYARFSSTIIVEKKYDFTVQNVNLKIGIYKYFSAFSDRVGLNMGVDLVSKSYKSNSTMNYTEDDIVSAESDTVLFAFSVFNPSSGGALGISLNVNLQVKLFDNLKLQIECATVPQYRLGFSYEIVALQAYTLNDIPYKNIGIDKKTNNEFIFNAVHLGVGLNWSF